MSNLTTRCPTAHAADLYRHHIAAMRQAARSVLVDPDLAEDAAHDAFLDYLTRPARFDPDRSSPVAYLRLLARRRAIDIVRKRERDRRREQVVAEGRGPEVELSTTGNETARTNELDVRRALRTLPPSQRTVVHRAFYHDLTYRQTATDLGIAEGTAKSRLRLAFDRLRLDPILDPAA